MSENEQKAGCVDEAAVRRLAEWLLDNAVVKGDRFGRVQSSDVYMDHARAALEAAALSPARSGEAVAWRYEYTDKLTGMLHVDYSGSRFCDEWIEQKGATETPLGMIAPRNESSGVSPGGGEENGQHCPKCRFTMSGLGYCVNCQPTPARRTACAWGMGTVACWWTRWKTSTTRHGNARAAATRTTAQRWTLLT